MIGVKTLAVVGLAGGIAAIAIAAGAVRAEQLAHLSPAAGLAVGLLTSLGVALVSVGLRPEVPSRTAVALRRGRPALVAVAAGGRAHELPALAQRACVAAAVAAVGLLTLTNEATARLAQLPSELLAPSRAEYCLPEAAPTVEPAGPPARAAPEAPAASPLGCALVQRAYALGYAKSLGSCAPRPPAAARAAARIERERAVCERRQLDEPFLHYAARRAAGAARDLAPVTSLRARVHDVEARLHVLGDLLADVRHSVTGTPHASHHLWITLPDPRPRAWTARLTGPPPCEGRFADLPLWPRYPAGAAPSTVLEHALGQLLFAARFGTPASCSDYAIHWGAPPDACARLLADPVRFLAETGALAPIQQVLDRRRRQLAVRALARRLGHVEPPPPPPARAVVSAACATLGGAGTPTAPGLRGTIEARDAAVDGQRFAVRVLRAPAIQPTGAGPLNAYAQLALLLGGQVYAGPARGAGARVTAEAPGPLTDPSFPLLQLEPLLDADPFLGATAPLERADLVDVYPFERHLGAFIDAFRRVYLAQRGRL